MKPLSVTVRLADDIHRCLIAKAEHKNVSVSRYIQLLVQSHIENGDLRQRIKELEVSVNEAYGALKLVAPELYKQAKDQLATDQKDSK